MKNFNRILEWLAKHLSLIIAVPAVLGGLWQLISLMLIDPAYIRFFSATQLLPDGLLIVLILSSILAIGYSFTKFFRLVLSKKSESEFNKEIENEPVIFRKIVGVLLLIFGIGITFLVVKYWPIYSLEKFSLILYIAIPFIYFLAITGLFCIIGSFSIIKTGNVDLHKYATSAMTILLILSIPCLVVFMFIKFNASFLIANGFYNDKYILEKAAKDNFTTYDKCEIIYFNDTYVFVEVETKTFPVIEVLKFDAFFIDILNDKAAD